MRTYVSISAGVDTAGDTLRRAQDAEGGVAFGVDAADIEGDFVEKATCGGLASVGTPSRDAGELKDADLAAAE